MASDQSGQKDLAAAVYQFSSSGTMAPGVTKDELTDWFKQQAKTSKAIDRQLTQEQAKHKTEIVILLLGTGESGKSTVAKQFRLINNNEYSAQELEAFVSIIHSNVLSAIRGGLRHAEEQDTLLEESVRASAEALLQLESLVMTEDVGKKVKEVWASEIFQREVMQGNNKPASTQDIEDASSAAAAASSSSNNNSNSDTNSNRDNNASSGAKSGAHGSSSASKNKKNDDNNDDDDDDDQETRSKRPPPSFQFDDGVLYFMQHIDRISTKGYVPSSQDILHARQKSTGIVETQFESHNALFRIVDVGGQRSERKKWSVLFSDITGIIFCADVSCYDTPLREDPSMNRMIDSLNTFQSICANKDLQSRDIILFLNKTDLLAKKVKRSPFPADLFPDAPQEPSYEEALKYIKSLYLAKNLNPNKFIYPHHTVATDTSSIKIVFTEIVKEIVRKDNVLASF